MGRSPCCWKEGVNKGAWTAVEDEILTNYIKTHGQGNWRSLTKKAGLNRCGKSCRLRWVNYLRPDIKRGNISSDEEDLIIRLHKLLGNKWSLIAGRLPARTDNEIKNYWNTNLGKKAHHHRQLSSTRRIGGDRAKNGTEGTPLITATQPQTVTNNVKVVRTKAVKCSKVFIHQEEAHNRVPVAVINSEGHKTPNDKLDEPSLLEDQDFIVGIDTEDNSLSNFTILDEALDQRWDNTLFGNQCFLDNNFMFSDRILQDLSAVNDRGQHILTSAFNPLTLLPDHGGDWMQY